MRISEESLHGFNHPYQLMAYRRGKRNPIADSVEVCNVLMFFSDPVSCSRSLVSQF